MLLLLEGDLVERGVQRGGLVPEGVEDGGVLCACLFKVKKRSKIWDS